MKRFKYARIAALAGLTLCLALATTHARFRLYHNSGVLPPNSQPYGSTYGEWSAEHWKWVYSMPADQHPLTDTADCSAGQSGQVWFLGGTYAPLEVNGVYVGHVTRECTVPTGTSLFFPLVDAEASTAEGNGTTEEELRGVAEWLVDHVVSISCEVDGVELADLDAHRAQSPLFEFGPLPENNLLGLPSGTTSPAVSDGYFVMLAPLSAGTHTIRFTSLLVFTLENDGFDFSFDLDITYDLTVVPRERLSAE